MSNDKRLAYILKTPCVPLIGDTGEATGQIVSFPVRLHWPVLAAAKLQSKPSPEQPNPKPKFSATFICHPEMPEAMLQPLHDLVRKTGEAAKLGPRFDAQGRDLWAATDVKTPIHSQFKKARFDGFGDEGYYFTAASNVDYPPSLFGLAGPLPRDTKEFYPGCWVVVKVSAWGKTGKNRFVSFNLLSVKKLGDDAILNTSGQNAADGMDGYAAMAGTGGMDAAHVGM